MRLITHKAYKLGKPGSIGPRFYREAEVRATRDSGFVEILICKMKLGLINL
jgi:hypothetical protein